MGKQLDKKKELCEKLETVRELLYMKIEENSDKEEIQHISEVLDKLIVEYIKEENNS